MIRDSIKWGENATGPALQPCRVLVIKQIGHLEHERRRDVRWVVATLASYNPLGYNGMALKTIMDESSMSCKSIHYIIIIQYNIYTYIYI